MDTSSSTLSSFTICNGEQIPALLTQFTLQSGADVQTFDLRDVVNLTEIYQILARRAPFPAYFGHNLDALYDAVGECATNRLDAQTATEAPQTPKVWLFVSQTSQEKWLFPIMDTLRDAASEFHDNSLSIVWLVL